MVRFQSRNRGTCRFKPTVKHGTRPMTDQFQSRNRGTCRFKPPNPHQMPLSLRMFQSRNRGTCRFKETQEAKHWAEVGSFNLVIEVLVVSRLSARQQWLLVRFRFNLVIEVLVVSRIQSPSGCLPIQSFNLVIEVLVVSRQTSTRKRRKP